MVQGRADLWAPARSKEPLQVTWEKVNVSGLMRLILHGAPDPSVMPWPCSADQDVKTSSLLSASVKSFQTMSAFGSSRQPFSGDKSSAGILLSAKRRRDVAATNSADAAAAVVL